ncbi:hypothetical protein DL765_004336 [Monosporascus sp. GIB2]|nr:hypothetical protein DL765_004336 [Monosporascus sp. GIB2]
MSTKQQTHPAPGQTAFAQKTSGGNNAYHNFHNDFLHVQDTNERRRLALAEIDKAPFGWYHVRACVVAGVDFFTDSYDIFAVSLLNVMLGIVYLPGVGILPHSSDNAIKLATSAGTVVGQLAFGYLADHVGRKRMYGLEPTIIIFATLGQALSPVLPRTLCQALSLLFATTKWRGAMMGAVFAMPANCDGYCAIAVDKMWRTLIGFGAVPAAIALYYRLTIPETPARKAAQQQLQVSKASLGDFIHHYSISKNGLLLLGTADSWFCLDVAFYGLSLNNASILETIGYSTKGATATYEFLYNTAVGNLIIVLAGTVPVIGCEVFPTRYRSTSYGISAASGKIGSIIRQGAISTLRSRGATPDNPNPWMDHVLEIHALFMLLGCFTTLLIPETKRRTLEELSGEDQPAPAGAHLKNGAETGNSAESL